MDSTFCAAYPPFPEVTAMAGLTHLHIAYHEKEAVSLECLHLKELTVEMNLLQEPVISSAAELPSSLWIAFCNGYAPDIMQSIHRS